MTINSNSSIADSVSALFSQSAILKEKQLGKLFQIRKQLLQLERLQSLVL